MSYFLSLFLVLLSLYQPVTATAARQDRASLRQKGQSALAAQNWTEAEAAFRSLTESDPGDAQAWLHLGYALHAQGKLADALPIHQKAAQFAPTKGTASYNAACVYALQKDADHAFQWLEQAIAAGFGDALTMEGDTDLAGLRADARFAKLLAEARRKSSSTVQKPFAVTTTRGSARLAYFGQGAVAQAMIDYGQPAWKDEYDQAITSGKYMGKRWRLGQDFWTHLDSFVPLTLGGTRVEAGYYYLVLEQRSSDQFVLTLLDPQAVRERRVDAFMAPQYRAAGIDVPLTHERLDQPAPRLTIDWTPGTDATKGTLAIRFGPHELTTPYECHLAPAKPKQQSE